MKKSKENIHVIPAKAGIHTNGKATPSGQNTGSPIRSGMTPSGKVRILVNKSNKRFYLQAVDPSGKVLASGMTGGEIKDNLEGAKKIGKTLAENLVAQKVKVVAFVKGKNQYHGKVKAAVEGMREGGLQI